MPNPYAVFGWSIDIAPGWNAQIRREVGAGESISFLAIVPESDDALLRLTPDERGIMGAAQWVELVGNVNRVRGRQVTATRCGDFTGYAVEYVTADEWLRGWALCANSVPLDVTYKCLIQDAGRDDRVVEIMLNSLRLARSSA